MSILKSESHDPDVALEFRDKFEFFSKLSCNLTDKLQSLLYLSENYVSASDFKQFINGVVSSWNSVNKRVRLLYFTFMHFLCKYLQDRRVNYTGLRKILQDSSWQSYAIWDTVIGAP